MTARMFVFEPSGRTMSPGFWRALQAPIHRAAVVIVILGGMVGNAGVPTRAIVSVVV